MDILMYKNDIPDNLLEYEIIAIDTETMGLCPHRDRLCLVQLCAGDSVCHIVQFDKFDKANNLKKLLTNSKITKIFHYARFDIMMLYKHLSIMTNNLYCTKIASKLVRTYTEKHGLLSLCKSLLNIEISKEQTCTDWGAETLTEEQKLYAANDVLYLHALKEKLDVLLTREGRMQTAKKCFEYLPTRVIFDITAGSEYDIFAHH